MTGTVEMDLNIQIHGPGRPFSHNRPFGPNVLGGGI